MNKWSLHKKGVLNSILVYPLLILFLFIFSGQEVGAQGFYKKRSSVRKSKKQGEVEHKKNIIWLEGLGSNQVVGAKYERIFMFGSVVSARVDAGITPFLLDERYNFIAGRSITPITGLGFYFHIVPFPVRLGLGCSVLHDVFFNGIPEIAIDSAGGGVTQYDKLTYRARIMPYVKIEVTIKERWTIMAGYSPIIDPPNNNQLNTYFTNWATFGVGYKFGR